MFKLRTLGVFFTTDTRPHVSPLATARALDLEAKAICDAHVGEPRDSGLPTAAETEIREYHVRALHDINDYFSRSLRSASARRARVRALFEQPFTGLIEELKKGIERLKANVTLNATRAQASIVQRRNEYDAFRAAHDLGPAPVEAISRLTLCAVLGACIAIHAAVIYGLGTPAGTPGPVRAFLIATMVAALCAALSFGAGELTRYINHRSPWRNTFGWAVVVIYAFLLPLPNLGVGLRRDATAGILTMPAAPRPVRQAVAMVREAIFHTMSAEAWALVAVGIVCGLAVFIVSYRSRDPYPGYSHHAGRLRSAERALHALKARHLRLLDALFEGGWQGGTPQPAIAARIDALHNKGRQAVAEYSWSAEDSARLIDEYRASRSEVSGSLNYCETSYRATNIQVRTVLAPRRFSQPPQPLPDAGTLDLTQLAAPPLDVAMAHMNLEKQALEAKATVLQIHSAVLARTREFLDQFETLRPEAVTALDIGLSDAADPVPARAGEIAS